MIALQIIFILSVLLIVHTYVIFPYVLKVISSNKSQNEIIYERSDDLPFVTILLAVYNEEQVIEQKILTTFNTNYPVNKIQFLIGSDASIDNTNEIIKSYISKYPIKLIEFEGRTGKSGIINKLKELSTTEILILTDANVFFQEDTIYQLVKHYKNNSIAQVGGNIINVQFKKDGISFQEKSYLSRENLIKYQEGIIWGTMIGTFGGCYSIRANAYGKVPDNFLVDDFYISMYVLEKGYKSINELNALCVEDVSNKLEEEFRRKSRISAGNFQNLNRFKGLLWPPYTGLAFCFISHKVLRWLGPILLITAFISSAFLTNYSNYYLYILLFQILVYSTPIIDKILKLLSIHIKYLRFANYLIMMNLALLKGMFLYFKGIKSSVWQPTQRNQ
jgi:cellulose synthase/poly-beta-1,6-N-acetylglucosamine synthase-like glycosyltransferase